MYRLVCFTGLMCMLAQAGPPPLEGMRLPKHGVYVVAHRGAHDGIPENTLAAYRKAIELGCDFVEVDLRATKDGHIVSIHNAMVDAYTQDAKGPVSGFTLKELRALDIGSRVGPEWREERIPTFEEILELCRGKIGIYLDLKQAPVEPIVALIQQYGMERDVLWYAGAPVIKRLREICPECIPMPDPGPERLLPLVLKTLEPEVVASVWKHYSEDFAKACHAAGAIVIVDEDSPACWDDMLAWKTDGIQTDHPEQLIAYLKARHTGETP
jgi:glycerophosphoryl diester phosphodiesterase